MARSVEPSGATDLSGVASRSGTQVVVPSYAVNEPSERPSPASITCTHRFASPHASLPDRAGETMSPFEVAKQTSRANSTHAGPHVVPKSVSRRWRA